MTVYVDSARHRFGRMLMSHMTADTMGELIDMGDMLGLSRRWLQQVPHRPHYDICQEKRALAIERGAKVVSSKVIARVARRMHP